MNELELSNDPLLSLLLQVATGSLESVRPMGVELLDTILDKVNIDFGSCECCYHRS